MDIKKNVKSKSNEDITRKSKSSSKDDQLKIKEIYKLLDEQKDVIDNLYDTISNLKIINLRFLKIN